MTKYNIIQYLNYVYYLYVGTWVNSEGVYSMKLFTIASLFSEVILPRKKIQLSCGSERLILIKAKDQLRFKWNQEERQAPPNQIITIRKNIDIINTCENYIEIKGIEFQGLFDRNLTNCFINSTDESVSFISKLLGTVNNEIPYHLIPQAESQFNLLYPSLLEITSKSLKVKQQVDEPSGKIDNRLIMVNRYIRQHYSDPLNLQILADLIMCNPIYLSNTYSKVFLIPPMKYLQNIRMKKARELLKNTKISIKDITVCLGYVSSSQFSSVFKHYNGCTPLEYRRSACMIIKREAVSQRDNSF